MEGRKRGKGEGEFLWSLRFLKRRKNEKQGIYYKPCLVKGNGGLLLCIQVCQFKLKQNVYSEKKKKKKG